MNIGGGYNLSNIVVGQEYKVGTITINGTKYDRWFKVVDFGTLPNSTTKNVAHGITSYAGFLDIGGASLRSSDSTVIKLPHISANVTISLVVTTTQISITSNSNVSAYDKSLVYLEYYR